MAAAMFLHSFEVGGVLSFPLDMLRYDRCNPEGPDDVEALAASVRREDHARHRYIRLVHIGHKSWTPTDARWLSFGWRVTKDSHKSMKIEY